MYCGACGAEIVAGDAFCRTCSKSVQANAQPAPSKSGFSGQWILFGILGLVAVGILTIATVATRAPVSYESAETAKASSGNPTNDMMLSLSPSQQALLLGKDVGCDGEYAFYNGMETRTALWSIRCADSRSFMISIDPDAGGSTKILDCSTLNFVTSSRKSCFKKFDHQ